MEYRSSSGFWLYKFFFLDKNRLFCVIGNETVFGLGDKETAVALHTFHSDGIATRSLALLQLTVIGRRLNIIIAWWLMFRWLGACTWLTDWLIHFTSCQHNCGYIDWGSQRTIFPGGHPSKYWPLVDVTRLQWTGHWASIGRHREHTSRLLCRASISNTIASHAWYRINFSCHLIFK